MEDFVEQSWVIGAGMSAGGFALLQVAGVQNALVKIAVGSAAGAGGAILHEMARGKDMNFMKTVLEAGGGAVGGAVAGMAGNWFGVIGGTGAVAGINYFAGSIT